jgi:hypothetical protein
MTETSTIIITLALVFYTIGVWSERIAGRLKWWHLCMADLAHPLFQPDVSRAWITTEDWI